MIPIVLLVFVLSGSFPCGFGHGPARRDDPASAEACRSLDATLLMERDGALLLVDPRRPSVQEIPLSPEVGRIAGAGQALLAGTVSGRWKIEWASPGNVHRIVVTDRRTGARVFDVSFDRRIELATAVTSPSGQFTVHIQGNNVASEVTMLDAASGQLRTVEIRHGARLAAFAMSVAIDPNERCAAISMERFGGVGAETWLLDLASGEVQPLPVPDAFVVGWARAQV